MKKAVFITVIAIFSLFLLFYTAFLFIVPIALNSNFISNKLNQELNLELTDYKIKTNPYFDITLKAKNLIFKKENKKALSADNTYIKYNLLTRKFKNIKSDYVFVDINSFLKKKSKKPFSFDFSRLTGVDIAKADILLNNNEQKINFNLSNLKTVRVKKELRATLKADIQTEILKSSVKINENGYLILNNNNLKAQNLEILISDKVLTLNGDIIDKKGTNLNLKAKDFPIGDTERLILYFMKLKKPDKKQFLENFKNFNGFMDINLTFKNQGIFGVINAQNLMANTVLYSIPILFKKAQFNFLGSKIVSNNIGTLGGEPVRLILNYNNLFTHELEIFGSVEGLVTSSLAKKYVKDLKVLNFVNVKLNFFNKHQKPDVNYLINLNKNSDISYKNMSLGFKDKVRQVFIQTHKEQDYLKITKYIYSKFENNTKIEVLAGDGLFLKRNNKMKLKYITLKTNGFAPVSIVNSFDKYVNKGYFKGSLKYDFFLKQLTGDFILKEACYKNFYVKTAQIKGNNKDLLISARGKYYFSPFYCSIKAQNDIFNNKLNIYEMYLFLDKYIIKQNQSGANKQPKEILKNAKTKVQNNNKEINVNKWIIKVNTVVKNKVKFENILITGSLKNDIFKFDFKDVLFAQGLLAANGILNTKTQDIKANLKADNINSNLVADNFFNLKNQVTGLASANLKAEMTDNFNNFKAHVQFKIDDGSLPKLGSTEFMFKNSQFKLINALNIDLSDLQSLSSDIFGSFDIDNHLLKNIDLKAQQKSLSLFIEGDYDTLKQNANLNLWGKYNKETLKGIRFLFIPVSWIINIALRPEKTLDLYQNKVQKIPPIETKSKKDEIIFRVKLFGNINTDNVNLELKKLIR